MRATLESSSKRGSFERISSHQEFWNFENWKWEIENIFCIVCELKESENHLSTSFKKLWVVGGWWWWWWWVVHWDYSVSSAPFVSELRLWELSLEIGAKTSRSQAWQQWQGQIKQQYSHSLSPGIIWLCCNMLVNHTQSPHRVWKECMSARSSNFNQAVWCSSSAVLSECFLEVT